MTRHQYGIAVLVSQTSFLREKSGGVDIFWQQNAFGRGSESKTYQSASAAPARGTRPVRSLGEGNCEAILNRLLSSS